MQKETKNNLKSYVFSTVALYGFSLLFSLFSLIFIIDKIPAWVQFAISFLFMAPTFFVAYVQGRTQGEKLFKAHAKTSLRDLHNEEGLYLPWHKCLFHVIGYIVPLFLLYIIAVIAKNQIVRLVAMIFQFPAALAFYGLRVLDLAVVTPLTLAIFLPYTLLVAGTFVGGYVLKIYRLKKQQADIESEIRMFDN